MRIAEIEAVAEAPDPQLDAIKQQEKQLRVRKARVKANKALQAVQKAQQG